MVTKKQNRRKKISKPRVFKEKRESMLLIETATSTDMYIWCSTIMFMVSLLVGIIVYAIMYS